MKNLCYKQEHTERERVTLKYSAPTKIQNLVYLKLRINY